MKNETQRFSPGFCRLSIEWTKSVRDRGRKLLFKKNAGGAFNTTRGGRNPRKTHERGREKDKSTKKQKPSSLFSSTHSSGKTLARSVRSASAPPRPSSSSSSSSFPIGRRRLSLPVSTSSEPRGLFPVHVRPPSPVVACELPNWPSSWSCWSVHVTPTAVATPGRPPHQLVMMSKDDDEAKNRIWGQKPNSVFQADVAFICGSEEEQSPAANKKKEEKLIKPSKAL